MSHCAGAFPTLCCAAWPLPLAPGNSHLLQPLILNPFLVLCRHISLFIVSSAITAWLYLHSTCKAVVLEQSRMQNWLGWSCTTSLSVCASPPVLGATCRLFCWGWSSPSACLRSRERELQQTELCGTGWRGNPCPSRVWRVSATALADMVPVCACTRGFGDTLSH